MPSKIFFSSLTLSRERLPDSAPKSTELDCALYCIVRAEGIYEHRFGAIHLFNELIIHDRPESRAMNITDDTHGAICQSAGNR